MFLGEGSQRSESAAASIGEDNINAACFLLDRRIQPVEVRKVRHVALDCGDVLADQLDGFIQFALPATGDEDLRAFRNKALRGGEADAAVASGYDRNFPFELAHDIAPSDAQFPFCTVQYRCAANCRRLIIIYRLV